MNTTVLRSAALACTLCSSALAQDVKYEKYKLPNGMTIILHEDHALPVATVNLWYAVGAQNEPKGRSGFAHLFEHLMFMGTTRVPGNDFDNLMEAGGGSNNASTNLDRTNYFSSGPSSILPTLLWLEADRIEDLGRAMTTEKLNKQRDIVRNEIRQNVENRPYGRLEDYVTRYVYPEGHPYYWNVYGTHADLEAATADNVRDFFATFYVPNNCSMVVAGDFDPAVIKPLIGSLFSGLPRGGNIIRKAPADVPDPTLHRVVRTSMLDKVDLPRIRFVYHSPPQYAAGDAELDLAAAILTQGKSSRLYKRLVLDEKLAVEVDALQDSATLGSLFTIDVMTVPNADLSRVEAIMDEEIKKLTDAPPSQEELDQRKSVVELGLTSRLDSLAAVADKLNAYQYAFGEPNSFKRDLDRYRNATPAAVQSWVAKTLTPNARAIMYVLPDEVEKSESARDKKPADLSLKPFEPAKPQEFKLPGSNINVLFWPKPELPLVTVELLIDNGSPVCPNDKAGLAYLTAEMLGEGAGERDTLAFADAVQAIGASFSARAGGDRQTFALDISVLARNFDKAVGLLADAARRPRFTQADFDRVKRIHLDDLRQELNEPAAVAGQVAARVLFGNDHPYAMPVQGQIATVQSLSLEDVKQLYRNTFNPSAATLLVSGDLTADQARTGLAKVFGDWQPAPGATSPRAAQITAAPSVNGLRLYIVDRPEAVQTVIRFAAPGPRAADPARAKLRVLNTLFGGAFTSRININLRERNGYAYGAASRFVMLPGAGYFLASSSVKAEVTGAALKEFLTEFTRIRGGAIGASTGAGDISDAEITKATQTVRTDVIQDFEGIQGPVHAAAALIPTSLKFDTIADDLKASLSVTASDLNGMARAAMPLENGVLVLVGDKKLILEQIKDLHLPKPVELTPEGEPVK